MAKALVNDRFIPLEITDRTSVQLTLYNTRKGGMKSKTYINKTSTNKISL